MRSAGRAAGVYPQRPQEDHPWLQEGAQGLGGIDPNHHEGYVSWTDYERNLGLIADNTNGMVPMSKGALRRGEALLAGLLRCGHCGRKLHVAYSGTAATPGAITVEAATSITAVTDASRSAACASTAM